MRTAGTFEDDIRTVTRARSLTNPPRLICAVAAGVREFGKAITDPAGTLGIAQWFPPLWQAASSLNTSTLFGAFEINPATGAQTSHQTVLLQWTESDRLVLA
ncbi:MAG TPA: hypothetical protein VFV73_32025 [Streptosporangiaceae bacterium]|nr:hypothetical protein [Streptosporangiaceae bacterium]